MMTEGRSSRLGPGCTIPWLAPGAFTWWAVCHRGFIVVDNFLGAEEVAAGVREGIQRLDHAGALRRGIHIQHGLRQDTLGDARTDCIGCLPLAVETHRPRQM